MPFVDGASPAAFIGPAWPPAVEYAAVIGLRAESGVTDAERRFDPTQGVRSALESAASFRSRFVEDPTTARAELHTVLKSAIAPFGAEGHWVVASLLESIESELEFTSVVNALAEVARGPNDDLTRLVYRVTKRDEQEVSGSDAPGRMETITRLRIRYARRPRDGEDRQSIPGCEFYSPQDIIIVMGALSISNAASWFEEMMTAGAPREHIAQLLGGIGLSSEPPSLDLVKLANRIREGKPLDGVDADKAEPAQSH
jgi:hypothetical protein